jgi:hypothetical protein
MSVIIIANYEGESFEVEIFHDGSIEFPGRDLQYEQALAEFYPPGSPIVQFSKMWHYAAVIFKQLELPRNVKPRLAADFAEHVLRFFEGEHPHDRRPRAAIEAARDFLDEKIDRATLAAAQRAALASAEADTGGTGAAVAAAAAWAATCAAGDATVWAAAQSAGYVVSSDSGSPEWQQAYDAERAWQVRRFVDCMEAIGQGKDWPDIGVTT